MNVKQQDIETKGISTVKTKLNNFMEARKEGTLFSMITITNNRLTSYAKKVCINLKIRMYACLMYLSFSLYQYFP